MPLQNFKGKRRLAKILYSNLIETAHDIEVEGKYGTSYLLPNLKEIVAFDIFVNGVYESKTISFLKKIIPANGSFLDLGANIGSILIPLLKLRPDIKALAIEAAPWVYEYLKRNIEMNKVGEAVEIFNYALYHIDDLELDFYSPLDQFGKGSLSAGFTEKSIKVQTRKVDTLLNSRGLSRVDTIKIDVEGFEYFVFQGAEKLLEREDAPRILFEFVDWAEAKAFDIVPGTAQSYLIDKGYKLFVMEGEKLVPLSNPVLKGEHNLFACK